jgi:inner membrane protease subunit 1
MNGVVTFGRDMMAAWRALLREAWERSVVFTQFICFLNVFSNHVAEVHQCLGPSMLPTFNVSGDILLLEHLSSKFEKVRPGDVVMARSPVNPNLVVCKRVLGLEGDRVTVLPTSSRGHVKQVVVPKGHVWLQGDNAYNSTDSRHYGPVPYALIQGKVFYRIWPPEGWGPVLNQQP